MPCASFSMLDGPGGTSQPVPPGPSSIEKDAHGIEKLLLKTQVSLTSFLQSEVKIIHIIVQNNTYLSLETILAKFYYAIFYKDLIKKQIVQ